MDWVARLFRRSKSSAAPACSWVDGARRAAVVIRACAHVRVGELEGAEQLLTCGLLAERDPARLNLLGVLCERRGRRRAARRYYRAAVFADGSCSAARQNIRRWFETDAFGASDVPLALGDEEPGLWWLRRAAVRQATDGGGASGRFRTATAVFRDN